MTHTLENRLSDCFLRLDIASDMLGEVLKDKNDEFKADDMGKE
jgi:hypothetical protein